MRHFTSMFYNRYFYDEVTKCHKYRLIIFDPLKYRLSKYEYLVLGLLSGHHN